MASRPTLQHFARAPQNLGKTVRKNLIDSEAVTGPLLCRSRPVKIQAGDLLIPNRTACRISFLGRKGLLCTAVLLLLLLLLLLKMSSASDRRLGHSTC